MPYRDGRNTEERVGLGFRPTQQHARTLNLLPDRGFPIGTGKVQLSTCKVRTPVRVVYHERRFHATGRPKAAQASEALVSQG